MVIRLRIYQRRVCSVCGNTFKNKSKLTKHYNIVHRNIDTLPCKLCGKVFNNKEKFASHLKHHEKPHKCPYCGKGFGNTNNLKTHMSTHTGNYQYNCSVCKKGFSRKGYLLEHEELCRGRKVDTRGAKVTPANMNANSPVLQVDNKELDSDSSSDELEIDSDSYSGELVIDM